MNVYPKFKLLKIIKPLLIKCFYLIVLLFFQKIFVKLFQNDRTHASVYLTNFSNLSKSITKATKGIFKKSQCCYFLNSNKGKAILGIKTCISNINIITFSKQLV